MHLTFVPVLALAAATTAAYLPYDSAPVYEQGAQPDFDYTEGMPATAPVQTAPTTCSSGEALYCCVSESYSGSVSVSCTVVPAYAPQACAGETVCCSSSGKVNNALLGLKIH